MQPNSMELRAVTAELKFVGNSNLPVSPSPELQRDSPGVLIKGRLARQRGFEVKALFDRLKETEKRISLLEATLREIQPHFFDDHPVSKKIVKALIYK